MRWPLVFGKKTTKKDNNEHREAVHRDHLDELSVFDGGQENTAARAFASPPRTTISVGRNSQVRGMPSFVKGRMARRTISAVDEEITIPAEADGSQKNPNFKK